MADLSEIHDFTIPSKRSVQLGLAGIYFQILDILGETEPADLLDLEFRFSNAKGSGITQTAQLDIGLSIKLDWIEAGVPNTELGFAGIEVFNKGENAVSFRCLSSVMPINTNILNLTAGGQAVRVRIENDELNTAVKEIEETILKRVEDKGNATSITGRYLTLSLDENSFSATFFTAEEYANGVRLKSFFAEPVLASGADNPYYCNCRLFCLTQPQNTNIGDFCLSWANPSDHTSFQCIGDFQWVNGLYVPPGSLIQVTTQRRTLNPMGGTLDLHLFYEVL